MYRLVASFVCTLALLLAGTIPVSAKSPPPTPTLSGETLNGTSITSSCTQNSPTSYTINWTVSGTATGPYPGTFTETGTITNPTTGVLTGGATFQIASPTGTVTGTKTMAHQTPNTATSCSGNGGLSAIENEFDYVARINAGQKNKDYCDSGLSSLRLFNGGGTPFFDETFASSQAATTRCGKA
jgi:hypothetical protein